MKKKKKDYQLVINDKAYYLPRPVWELMLKLHNEKDYWKAQCEERQGETVH